MKQIKIYPLLMDIKYYLNKSFYLAYAYVRFLVKPLSIYENNNIVLWSIPLWDKQQKTFVKTAWLFIDIKPFRISKNLIEG